MIISNVTGIAHRRPQGESYDQAIRNDETGLWQCPFCQQDNFPELSEVTCVASTSLAGGLLPGVQKQGALCKASGPPGRSCVQGVRSSPTQ